MTPRVAVTGVGAVGAFGTGSDALAAALAGHAPAPAAVDRSAGYHRPGGARRARLAVGVDLSALVPPAQARRMSPPARFAMAATRLALAEAGLAGLPAGGHARTAIVAGTAFGPAQVTEQLLRQIFGQGPEAASPALFTESVASASSSHIALALGARGPNLAITQREASDLLALAEGVRLVATGAAERAVIVVVEEMIPLLHAVLDRFRALALPGADGEEVARPFDRRRSGVVGAEGAAALVLEPEAAAEERGARALATVAATVRGFDPSAPAWDWGEGDAGLARRLARGLARAGVAAGSLDLVVSGASGARRGDRLEAAVLGRLFGGAPPAVTAPKGALGEYGGGLLAAAVLVAAGRALAPTLGFAEADPALGLSPVVAGPLARPRRLLVSALASGGAAAWAVLDAVEPRPARAV
ncbi:MAG TPA: beta-ketoacyl synthase N-terminal-like domain-containing protein [Solirubrobacteraceae bacterium]|nr:beta-ketoacyl synthase N-terminal-like domain-containing protein [Solirubrobacteraceae bacterium]